MKRKAFNKQILFIGLFAGANGQLIAMEPEHPAGANPGYKKVQISNQSVEPVLVFTASHSGANPIRLNNFEDSEELIMNTSDKIYLGKNSGMALLELHRPGFGRLMSQANLKLKRIDGQKVASIRAFNVIVLIKENGTIQLIDRTSDEEKHRQNFPTWLRE